MNKTALEKFAKDSRNKLREDVKIKLLDLDIDENGVASPESPLPDIISFNLGKKLYGKDVEKYKKLVREIEKREKETDKKTAYETIVEEVAYTWFNRIIAIRFMEVNRYMPNRMRILSSGIEEVKEPEFITKYMDTDIGIEKEEFERLDNLKLDGSKEAMDEMFQFMFIKQCNSLNEQLPELFEKIDDYMELLLNISYIDESGVIYRLIEDIEEDAFDIEKSGQIEIIGWMYQYYNVEVKEEVDKSKKKVNKDTLPAKTQLFTPDWIVKYMVENSLGRLLIERKISKGSDKKEKELAKEYGFTYYLEEAEQIDEVEIKLKDFKKCRKDLDIGDIRFIDPSMGSGHILIYAFELFLKAYLEEGYREKDAVESIIKNNLYGLDIDKRAYQLAYFALMMKARQYSRKVLEKKLENNIAYFIDSKSIDRKQIGFLGCGLDNREKLKEDILDILNLFKYGRELGSILKIEKDYNYEELNRFIDSIDEGILPMELMGIENTQEELKHILYLTEILDYKYDIVVTNPPYLGRKHMGSNLTKYLDKVYSNTKADLFAVFMEKSEELVIFNGYYGMINQHSWMFLSSFEKYREEVLNNSNIVNMLHLGPRAFEEISGEVVQSTAFIIKKKYLKDYVGCYIRLVDFNNAEEKRQKTLEVIENQDCGYYYETKEDNFKLIPGSPIAYWASARVYEIFEEGVSLGEIAKPRKGNSTSNNKRFLRYWYEVEKNKINFNKNKIIKEETIYSRWFPYNKGGGYRKWYGNNEYLIDWKNDAEEMRKIPTAVIANYNFFMKPGLTWSTVTSKKFSIRNFGNGFIFDNGGCCLFGENKNLSLFLGLMNSKVFDYLLGGINPTLNYQSGEISKLPILLDFLSMDLEIINKITEENIEISKIDWDSDETSWDFEISPLLDESKIDKVSNIEEAYESYKTYANANFERVKENEERLNEIFIEIYGLEDELDKYVIDKDITITKVFDDKKDIYEEIKGNQYIRTREDIVKDFISYGLGCIFGRYSLDEKGLAFAGGDFDLETYNILKPIKDNVGLISDEEYFEDDLLNKFVEFVEKTFGKENLEENLRFIGDNLKGKGTPREKIRNYFMKDFYSDHVRKYQKTPIYWMYSSGAGKTKRQQEDGFKALVYMHRYNKDTTGNVRIDHLHELQRLYDRRMDFLNDQLSTSEGKKGEIEKEIEKLRNQIRECKEYDENIGHMAIERVDIDLDDGVKVNYEEVQTDKKGDNYPILEKI